MLNPASSFPAPVQSTTSLIVTNNDDSMKPATSIEYSPEPYLPEYEGESFKPTSLSHYAEDHFIPKKAIKDSTMKKAVGLAAALGGFMYLSNKWEKAEAEKTKQQLMEKLKTIATHSSASKKTNTLLAWFLGLGGTGLASYAGIEAVKFAQAGAHRQKVENAFDDLKNRAGVTNGTLQRIARSQTNLEASNVRLEQAATAIQDSTAQSRNYLGWFSRKGIRTDPSAQLP